MTQPPPPVPAYVLSTPHGTHLAHCVSRALAEQACQVLITHYGAGCCFVQAASGEECDAQGCILELFTRDEDTELVLGVQVTLDPFGGVITRQVMTLRGLVWNEARQVHGRPVAYTLDFGRALALLAPHLL
ncbi:hypothetical protein [Deinococcus sp. DB0503]|uniref:hypothetical protein n=1 Tax=Deinococcus sp. DB0503 TaxID=2479203 RepID=UPI0018E03D4B|nr:hypothetical protein [Deinococcus sp. DB0503]MBI0446860.1 hypothetical protein [Deinococcus sp. DB0503]